MNIHLLRLFVLLGGSALVRNYLLCRCPLGFCRQKAGLGGVGSDCKGHERGAPAEGLCWNCGAMFVPFGVRCWHCSEMGDHHQVAPGFNPIAQRWVETGRGATEEEQAALLGGGAT